MVAKSEVNGNGSGDGGGDGEGGGEGNNNGDGNGNNNGDGDGNNDCDSDGSGDGGVIVYDMSSIRNHHSVFVLVQIPWRCMHIPLLLASFSLVTISLELLFFLWVLPLVHHLVPCRQ